MRQQSYLSHSALQLWDANRSEYYLKYLSDARTPREPQTQPMCVGSAFDAFVKAALHHSLFAHDKNGEFALETIFESQVESHNRDFAYPAGEYIFKCYCLSGRYAELLKMLTQARHEPRFEFTVQGEVGGVPLIGKPDCGFTHRSGIDVVLDFKVKGFCSKYTTSPSKGYRIIRDGYKPAGKLKASRNNGEAHKEYVAEMLGGPNGIEVNKSYLEQSNETHAEQLAVYGWLLNEPVGSENVAFMVDEIVGKYTGPDSYPLLRIATLSARVKESFQTTLLSRYQSMWKAIQSGHIFTDMNREANDDQCEMMDKVAISLAEAQPGDFFTEATRGNTYHG